MATNLIQALENNGYQQGEKPCPLPGFILYHKSLLGFLFHDR